jgi:Na+/proline symporter
LLVCDWFPERASDLGSSRLLSGAFGAATIGMSLVAPYLGEHVFDIIIRVSGALFGPLLGLFLLGATDRRANAPGALSGLTAGVVSLVVIYPTAINAWWYGSFTCVPTLAVGAGASRLFPALPAAKVQGLLLGDFQDLEKDEEKPRDSTCVTHS